MVAEGDGGGGGDGRISSRPPAASPLSACLPGELLAIGHRELRYAI